MPIIKSAKKRVRVAKKATLRNRQTKRSLKGALKVLQAAISGGKADAKSSSAVQSTIDKAVKKGVMHKNKAARLKKRAAASAKAAGAKPATKAKTAAKKPVAKKPVAKKAPAKKPAAKKTTKK